MVNILKLKQVDSTNDFAKKILRLYPPQELNNTVVCTPVQTNGRGMAGNKWISEPNKNLTFSLIHIPAYLYLDELFYLSKASALAIATYLEQEDIPAFIKWPNDILVFDKKIAGILIENSISFSKIKYSIIGIGLNVNQTVFPPQINATSMKLIKNHDFDLDKTLNLLLEKLMFWLEQLEMGKFNIIDEQYLRRLYLYKQKAKFRKNGDCLEGIIVGVDQFGRLLLDVPSQNSMFAFSQKEIELVR